MDPSTVLEHELDSSQENTQLDKYWSESSEHLRNRFGSSFSSILHIPLLQALSTCLNFSHSLKHFHHPDYNVVFYMSSSKAQDPKPHLRSMIRDGVMIQSLFNVSAISSFDRKRWKEDILLDLLSVTRTTVCRRA
ncbi:uncharacterized protein YALI1_F05205g [Yarrowia lipolytica]|uniref:Uncharacterized protein n=1 Tax=Yarrowia lipolytica TaxID=4952 RepID=A0A1D8NLU1_YARLL|nr:hypothetical protein YALI1_F05205g [Yarrowia lipolytica]